MINKHFRKNFYSIYVWYSSNVFSNGNKSVSVSFKYWYNKEVNVIYGLYLDEENIS